jgi:hypothetical protein
MTGSTMRLRIGRFVDLYALGAVTYVLIASVSAGVEWSTFLVLKAIGVFEAAVIAFFLATFANLLCHWRPRDLATWPSAALRERWAAFHNIKVERLIMIPTFSAILYCADALIDFSGAQA